MDPSLARFLANTNTAPEEAALVLFRLLKKNSRTLLLAAVREAVGAVEYLLDLLREDHGIPAVAPPGSGGGADHVRPTPSGGLR